VSGAWHEVGDRVWVRRYELLDQTIAVVGSASGLVVIDTRSSHLLADELRDDLRRLPGSVMAVVNTHGHWDHSFGNARFVDAPIWGHVRCATMVTERGEEMRARVLEWFGADGMPGIDSVELVPPNELFEDAATLDLGDRQVELAHLGLGHTDNDIVIRVPDAGVLVVGDLLENAPAPSFGDSYPLAWAETGRRLLGLVDGVVVPGHGDPFDIHFATEQVEQLGQLADLCREAASGAIGLDEAIRRSPFPADPTGDALDRGRLEISSE
jgi:glyoxylase-like metal-dependent hydrolase (beta-lactamase superfamily II)